MSEQNSKTPLDELRQNVEQTREQLQKLSASLDGLNTELSGSQRGPGKGLDSSLLNEAMQRLSASGSQKEILEHFLAEVARFADQGVLFLNREDKYELISSFGPGTQQLSDLQLSDANDPVLEAATERELLILRGEALERLTWFGHKKEQTREIALIPIVFHSKTYLVLLAASSDPIDVDSIEVLAQFGKLILQNHSLAQLASWEPPQEDSRWPALETRPEKESRISEETTEQTLSPDQPEEGETPAVGEEPSLEEEYARAMEGLEMTDLSIEEPAEETEEEEVTVLESVDQEEVSSLDEEAATYEPKREDEPTEEEGSWEESVDAAPHEEREQEEGQFPSVEEEESEEEPEEREEDEISEEETQLLHEEASRFARLLVTEVKLYNEETLEQARQSGDIYDALREEIERSRVMYEKRAHPLVQTEIDYLDAEIIRILAEDNPRLMGEEYPGPQVTGSVHEIEADQNQ